MSEIIKKFAEKGFLISPTLVPKITDHTKFLDFLETNFKNKISVVTEEIYKNFVSGCLTFTKNNKDVKIVKEREVKQDGSKVEITKIYEHENKKRDISDWVGYYNSRFEQIKNFLYHRIELQGAISINRLISRDMKELATIAMVKSISKSKFGNFIIELEDTTGVIKGVVSKNSPCIQKVEELVEDEVIGVLGSKSREMIFIQDIIFPDIPEKETKKCNEEVYACFIADTHVGSKMFLSSAFDRFLKWLNLELGDEKQKEIAKKIRYLFVVGDLVDGVGIYPEQENELLIKDIYQQYEEFAKLIQRVPERISVIISPGNHDALRIAEPQHALYDDIAKPVYQLPNVIMTSNPSYVRIHAIDDFPGFDVLLYHGYSLDYFVANVPKLRRYGYERADLLMKFLLRKRHLAPTHGSTLFAPMQNDFLVIDKVPDIFATAHIHKARVGCYRNVINICCSCWQDRTVFQERVGHVPEPGRVPIFNLKTREVKMMRFI
ncbi:MAG: DNA-directed DNA polymerase II small subunit [Candidatus Parvarchaeota archaeon]|nr:DNA-directed DNA polymerase II small subunit [Candidatus Jingweiarchaeum tengchongense]MCW1298386.1 DNA-directed DNA polymerase II small subunit [Candidatus Jingweiarchaeum tengchongense]MCW1300312.1 DNA-directed DNA polymerase II small subunit [Candidatus Jingweiarchaeum tengchongense]MCW1304892.1 DNA-directed DNA polymerase II small subunit [Candidatus Jingweiarchaeum tengchongense]MCW1305808.1 DNA-directed DNA polymerase II small subunit [Candidatus Jingweiarchaeum tengchongense]